MRRQRQVVEHGHDAHPVARVQRDQQLHHVHLVAQVEMHGRLVEDEHAWRLREGHGEHDELPLTLGEAPRVAPHEVRDAHPLDGRSDRGVVGGAHAAEGVLVRDAPEGHHLLDAPRAAEHGQSNRVRARADDDVGLERDAIEMDGATPLGRVAGENAQEGRLAGPVRAKDGHALPCPDMQVEPVEDGALPVGKADAAQLVAVGHVRPRSRRGRGAG